MRKNIVAGNWKMNKDFSDAADLVEEIVEFLSHEKELKAQMIICPPLTYMELAGDAGEEAEFFVGAQNVSQFEEGAYTGEVSAQMLDSMEITYCIVGHSERRKYFNEDHAVLAEKVNRLMEYSMTPIFCCGEQLEERENGNQNVIVKAQLTESLFHLTTEQMKDVVIAYEPVWAIGTGKTATTEQAQEMHAYIRSLVSEKYGNEIADNTSILYGGSCNANNAKELFSNPDVDGGLIGGASLKATDFMAIAKSF